MSQRAMVTVVRGYGDPGISDAIMRGVVSREIRLMQAERDMLRKRKKEDIQMKIAIANERYAIKPENPIRRMMEQAIAFLVELHRWHRQQIEEDDTVWWP